MAKKNSLDKAGEALARSGVDAEEIASTALAAPEANDQAGMIYNPVAERIREAKTLDDILETGDLLNLEDAGIFDQNVWVTSWESKGIGDYGTEWGIIGVAANVTEDGEITPLLRNDGDEIGLLSCSSENIIAQFERMAEIGVSLPVRVRFIERQTKRGYTVYRMVKPAKD